MFLMSEKYLWLEMTLEQAFKSHTCKSVDIPPSVYLCCKYLTKVLPDTLQTDL